MITEKLIELENFKNSIIEEAQVMAAEIVANRRELHSYAEVEFELPKTVSYIKTVLRSYGYDPIDCGKSGFIVTVGKAGKTILLRADMDALPIKEGTGLEFAADNGNSHACGHDFHPAMLLGAAKLLKQHEAELQGTVKLMFQPAEEILQGAKDMIDHGVLLNPKVDVAFAIHLATGDDITRSGTLICKKGPLNRSGDAVKIIIHGKDTHGSRAYSGVDALSIASYVNLALQTIVAREIPCDSKCVVLVGTTHGGTSLNSVAGEATLEVSVRTDDNEQRKFILQRIKEVAEGICAAFRAKATVEHMFGAPVMHNDATLASELIDYATELLGEGDVNTDFAKGSGGGEDFGFVAQEVPSTLFYLGAGSRAEGYTSTIHTPHVVFNEDVLPIGAAVHTYFAMRWLEDHE